MTATIGDNYLDSRYIQDRIKELESLREDFQLENNLPDWEDSYLMKWKQEELKWPDEVIDKWYEWEKSDEGQELEKWLSFPTDDSEWEYGITFIREDEFVDFCEQDVKDLGYLPEDLPWWIENNIDWEGMAEDLSVDYSEVNVEGYTYYYRS